MKRCLLALILGCLCAAFAPWHGNVQLGQCGTYIDGKTIGDTICASTPGQILYYVDNTTPQWEFDSNSTICPSFGFATGNGHLSILYSIFGVSPCAAKVDRCGNPGNTSTGTYTEFVAPNEFVVLAFPSIVLGSGLCAPLYDFFQNASNRGRDGNTAQEAFNNAQSGDTLTFVKMPPSLALADWAFMGVGEILVSNLTINCDAGWKTTGFTAPQPPSHASMVMNAAGTTINNCDFEGPVGAGIHLVRLEDQQTSLTLNNVTIRNNIGLQGGDGLLTAGSAVNDTGTVALLNSLVDNNGDCSDFGQYHNIYIGVPAHTTGAHHLFNMQNSKSLHGGCGGESLKAKAQNSNVGTTTPNTIAQLNVGGAPGNGGGHVINFPYGGVVNLSNNIIEQGPWTNNTDAIGFGLDLCLDRYTAILSNSFTINNNWIIIDTISSPAPSLNPAIIIHISPIGPDCVTPFTPPTTISNTKIVINNPNGFGVLMASNGASITDGGGNDLYCGSTHYTSPIAMNATLSCTGGDGSGRIAAGLPPFSDSLASLPDTPPH